MVCVGKEVENGKVDAEDTDGGACNAHRGDDPWDTGVRCPSEPEETTGKKDGAKAREVETTLGGGCSLREVFDEQFILDDGGDSCDN